MANKFNSAVINNSAVSNNSAAERTPMENANAIDTLLAEGAKRKKRGNSASAQVTYLTLSKAIKVINVALERVEGAKDINAPKLREELKVCGFGKFCTDCVPFMWGTHTLIMSPAKGESDFRLIQRVDAEGRPVYSPAELVRAFENKFEMALEAERARKDAEREAKRAERAAKRVERDASAKAAANETRKMFEGLMGRALTDGEFEQMVAKLKKSI